MAQVLSPSNPFRYDFGQTAIMGKTIKDPPLDAQEINGVQESLLRNDHGTEYACFTVFTSSFLSCISSLLINILFSILLLSCIVFLYLGFFFFIPLLFMFFLPPLINIQLPAGRLSFFLAYCLDVFFLLLFSCPLSVFFLPSLCISVLPL